MMAMNAAILKPMMLAITVARTRSSRDGGGESEETIPPGYRLRQRAILPEA